MLKVWAKIVIDHKVKQSVVVSIDPDNFYEGIKEENIESFKFYLNNSLTKLQKDIFNLRYDKKGNILFEIEEIASKYNTTVDNINIILNIIFKTK